MSAPLNPPAFPVAIGSQHDQHIADTGMDLRDWFAGQALSSLLYGRVRIGEGTPPALARQSYQLADAMLAERAKS